jgi:transcriptional regulator GlxA family with amidase domain
MREVGILLYDGVQALDVVGPFEAFHAASEACAKPAYRLRTISVDGRPIRSETGLTIGADAAIDDVGRLHTLYVPGGAAARRQPRDDRLVAGLARLAARTERLVSVCTGAFLVAEAGLAKGRRVATHWRFARDLAQRFPDIEVDADRLYLCDRGLYSSAGILAGVDLTLALIEADLGETVATAVARMLVIYLRRSGGQAQFSEPLRAQGRLVGRFASLSDWVRENLDGDLNVEALAERVGYSPRHFRRVLRKEIGATPARFVEDVRLDVARELLATGAGDIKQIAVATGFGSADVFRRAFRRRFFLSPADYRERFNAAAPGFDAERSESSVSGVSRAGFSCGGLAQTTRTPPS